MTKDITQDDERNERLRALRGATIAGFELNRKRIGEIREQLKQLKNLTEQDELSERTAQLDAVTALLVETRRQRDEALQALREINEHVIFQSDTRAHQVSSICNEILAQYDKNDSLCTCRRFSDGVKVFPERKCEWCKENGK